MAKTKKPTLQPSLPFPTTPEALHMEGHWLWISLRKEWRDVTTKPEEVVRQKFIRTLVEHYGYALNLMDQEQRTQHGHKSPRADIVIWQSLDGRTAKRFPVLVVECKTDSIEFQERDYYQAASYTVASGCEIFIATNQRHTAVFKLVARTPSEFVAINEIPKATDWGDAKRLKEVLDSLRVFNRKEFQDLLFVCHSILRDVHKMDPGHAFDTISKILFIKMYVERSGQHGTFTTDYRTDDLFTAADKLDISKATFRRIVKQLERFDLSKTGDDIKGLAFEKFLGTTFRGELGQFFTPRPVVEFMVDLLNPQEGQLIRDPASGSGGFLIRAFEHVRSQIVADIQRQKDEERTRIEALGLPEDEEERQIEEAFSRLNLQLLPSGDDNQPIDTRVGRLAWQCIFGTDAEPRAARTAKMNMIMHGDGHGGIHYHDGLLDINGIFNGRFDLVLTNPPFGSNVGSDQKVGGSDETRVPADVAYLQRCRERGYGTPWEESHNQLLQAAASKTSILDLFEIGKGKNNRPTELIFVERRLNLLKPGGRMGIVLPDGNLNNPSLAWLRRWAKGRAKLLAVVSLPEETFRPSNATVKASLVFLRKFTDEEAAQWEAAWQQAHAELDAQFNTQRHDAHADLAPRICWPNSPHWAFNARCCAGSVAKPRPEYEVKTGDVLISRANVVRYVGACAYVESTPSHLMLCDKIFRARFRSGGRLLPQFLAEAMKLRSVREHIESRLTGTSPTMKNISKPALLDIRFPLPDAHTQQQLVDEIAASTTAASSKRTEAATLRQSAWTAFEAALFTAAEETTT